MPGEEEQLKHWIYFLLTSTGRYGCKCGLHVDVEDGSNHAMYSLDCIFI